MSDPSRPRFPWSLLCFWLLRVLPAWGVIALLIFLMQISVSAIVHDNENVKSFLAFIDLLPAIVKTALGGEMLQSGSTTALLTIGYQHPFVMFLCMLFAVGVPAGLLTAEVQRGTMELILSRPVTKTQIYLCVALLTLTGMFGLVMVMFLGTVAGVNLYPFEQPIPLDLFLRLAINGGLLASTFGAFSLLCAASFGRLYSAIGVSVVFLSLNYFVHIVSEWWPRMWFLKRATLFYLVFYSDVMHSWPFRNMAILAGFILVAATAGAIIWRRRDLPL